MNLADEKIFEDMEEDDKTNKTCQFLTDKSLLSMLVFLFYSLEYLIDKDNFNTILPFSLSSASKSRRGPLLCEICVLYLYRKWST